MTHTDPSIERSYRFCHAMAKQAGSSFYPCFVVLPKTRRRAMEALYAFMRHTDDLADRRDTPAATRLADLDAWRSALEESLNDVHQGATGCSSASAGNMSDEKTKNILPALAHAVHQFHIPVEHLHAVIDGMEMDVHGRSYATFDQLAEYCHCVASAVGLACIHIWGFHGPEPTEPARCCGLAFQLTNILRDLKEDAELGRIYLPDEDFRQCGYSADALRRGESGESFARLMQMEIDRAERLYREGAQLFDQLERPGRRIFGLMFGVYHELLEQIRRDPAAVLSGRVRLGRCDRLRLAARWLLLPPGRRILP